MSVTALSRDGVLWWYTGTNPSPRVTPDFLARQRRLLLPAQYAREHENAWVDAADSFTSAAEVDAAMDESWIEDERGDPAQRYTVAVDLGLVSDPTVVAIGSMDNGFVCVNRLITVQGSRERPVQINAVECLLIDLAEAFAPKRIIIESWQGVGAAQSLQRLGLPVEITTPTPKSNSEQWSLLARLLTDRRLVLPPHPQLRAELLGLTYELSATGIRVTGGAPHQDHAVVVRMLAATLGSVPRPPLRVR